MKYLSLAAILLAASTSCAWAQISSPQPPRAPAGIALMVASDVSGGIFASGDVASYRVLNASPSTSMGSLNAFVPPGHGFKVIRNGCSAGLAPRQECTVLVGWNSLTRPSQSSSLSHADLVVSGRSPSVEVRSSMTGNSTLSPR